jgi:hypothetical protein
VGARDFDLPEPLEALLVAECEARGVAERSRDELRMLLSSPPESWPTCCRGSCQPCVDEQTSVARAILARWRARQP